MAINKVILTGTLDYKKKKYTTTGSLYFSALMSVPVSYESNGVVNESVVRVPIVAWGDLAEALDSIEDNAVVSINGRLKSSSYQSNKYVDKQGNPATIYSLKVTVVKILDNNDH